MKLRIGFSPCPNDTFIFDALVNGKIDTRGLAFEPVLEDVETLNEWGLEGKLDITKLSFPAFFRSLDQYVLLDAGSALGKGVGPLLVTANTEASNPDFANANNIDRLTVALPGINTTAHLLFSFAYPKAAKKSFLVFSAIEDQVISKQSSLGVIIHENRFTYAAKGLHKVIDLGSYWEEKIQAPVPLGGIAIRRNIPAETALKVNSLIADSLRYAWKHSDSLPAFVRKHAQAMHVEVMKQHIDLYVNQFSLQLGREGKEAIRTLYQVFEEVVGPPGNKTGSTLPLFLTAD